MTFASASHMRGWFPRYHLVKKRPHDIPSAGLLFATPQCTVTWCMSCAFGWAGELLAAWEALRHLDTACAQCFRRVLRERQGKVGRKVGDSTFKSKTRGLGRFRLTGRSVVFPCAAPTQTRPVAWCSTATECREDSRL